MRSEVETMEVSTKVQVDMITDVGSIGGIWGPGGQARLFLVVAGAMPRSVGLSRRATSPGFLCRLSSAASPERRRASSTNSFRGTGKTTGGTIRLHRPRPPPRASSSAIPRRQTQPEIPRGPRRMLAVYMWT